MESNPIYSTNYGAAYVGDSLLLLDQIEANSIDLVLTSPPFALQRQKRYGNVDQEEYVEWLLKFCSWRHGSGYICRFKYHGNCV